MGETGKTNPVEEAWELLEWHLAVTKGKWEWPITRNAGESSESWVSVVFAALEQLFAPGFDPMAGIKIEGKTRDEIQRAVNANQAVMQRDVAARLWVADRELAQRYADVLRLVDKPAGLSPVESRTPFLDKIEHLCRKHINGWANKKESLIASAGSKATIKAAIAEEVAPLREAVQQIITLRIQKRQRTARKNGSKGGAPSRDDTTKRKFAAEDVMRDRFKPDFNMAASCRRAIKKHGLTIKWPALAKVVRAMLMSKRGTN